MVENRRKIGLVFSYSEAWVAGAYYIYNLIHALNTLPDPQLPVLVIFTNSRQDYDKLVQETSYPYMRPFLMRKTGALGRIMDRINSGFKRLFGYYLFDSRPTPKDVECVFPLSSKKNYFEKVPKCIYWIPDFQEHFYPQFFSAKNLEIRKAHQVELSRTESRIVFSSCNVKNHYQELYPHNNSKVSVVNFAVTHRAVSTDIDIVKMRYGISRKYFLCSNQFWKHKNHQLVLNAIALAKRDTSDIFVVFTGKGEDYRNPDYYGSLEKLVEELGIGENVTFLGLIPRVDQLALLKDAIAVIQPSLFEGWSTVIEDAKSFSQFIMASAIEVHKEQIVDYPNSCLFDYLDPEELSRLLIKYQDNEPDKVEYSYRKKVDEFVLSFLKATNG